METCHDVLVPDTEAYDGKKMYLAITDIDNKMPIFPQENAGDK